MIYHLQCRIVAFAVVLLSALFVLMVLPPAQIVPIVVAGEISNNYTASFAPTLQDDSPVSLGNLVWLDANNNSMVDAGESGIAGVTLVLWIDEDDDGLPDVNVGETITTAADGTYEFTDLAPGNYVVQIPLTNFGPGGPLEAMRSSSGGGFGDGPTPDPDDGVDGDDNGLLVNGFGVINRAVTLMPDGEPTDDEGINSNLTVDFGFFFMMLGDVNCDGVSNFDDVFSTLEYSVGLRTASDGCPMPEDNTLNFAMADVDTNEKVNAIDALFMLQCYSGLSSVLCPSDDIGETNSPADEALVAAELMRILAEIELSLESAGQQERGLFLPLVMK